MSKMYRVIAEWKMYGVMYVEADSKEQAIELAYGPDYPLPDEQHYLDGTFDVNPAEVDEVEHLVDRRRVRR